MPTTYSVKLKWVSPSKTIIRSACKCLAGACSPAGCSKIQSLAAACQLTENPAPHAVSSAGKAPAVGRLSRNTASSDKSAFWACLSITRSQRLALLCPILPASCIVVVFSELNGIYFRGKSLQKDLLLGKHPSNRCGNRHACSVQSRRTRSFPIAGCARSRARLHDHHLRRVGTERTQVKADDCAVVQKCSRPPRRPRSCGCGRWSTSTTSSAPCTSASGSKPIVDIVRMSQMLPGQ
jgi:hypothetical protein